MPELPPRIDRASKPTPSTPGSSLPSRNSSSVNSASGTLGRTAQERLFGNNQKQSSMSPEDQQDPELYASNKLLNTMEPAKKLPSNGNSLERRDIVHSHHHHHSNPQNSLDRQNSGQKNGYDSVSSYDSYNINQPQQAITTSTSSLQTRLGPNAPDDLKSIPPPTANRASLVNSQEYATNQRNSMHERDYSFNGMDSLTQQQSRNSTNLQRPTNLLIESPRKPHMLETKTDYGKYR